MNAYNFMDGINGIAGMAALIAAIFLGFISFSAGALFVVLCCYCMAFAVSGFLIYNFPGGRIFMGDTGSQFIGFVFASLAVFGTSLDQAQLSIYVVPVLFFPFLFDVVMTLIYRALRRQNLTQAHREHLYQIGNKLGYSHVQVTLAYSFLFVLCGIAAINLQWASPAERLALIGGLIALFCVMAVVVYDKGLKQGVVERLSVAKGAQ